MIHETTARQLQRIAGSRCEPDLTVGTCEEIKKCIYLCFNNKNIYAITIGAVAHRDSSPLVTTIAPSYGATRYTPSTFLGAL